MSFSVRVVWLRLLIDEFYYEAWQPALGWLLKTGERVRQFWLRARDIAELVWLVPACILLLFVVAFAGGLLEDEWYAD